MKLFTIILLSIFLGKGCSNQVKNNLENTKIVYSANSRGLYLKITIQNQEISVSKNRREEGNGTTTKISDADWKQLVTLFNKIDLDKLGTYEGSTKKRFYDGASMANMTITYKEKEYQSTTFDHGTPPVEIADFVNNVTSLVK
jgi:hypothetical protein